MTRCQIEVLPLTAFTTWAICSIYGLFPHSRNMYQTTIYVFTVAKQLHFTIHSTPALSSVEISHLLHPFLLSFYSQESTYMLRKNKSGERERLPKLC